MGCLRVVRVVALLILLMAISLSAALPARPAAAKNTVHVDQRNKVITITVKVTVVGANAAGKATFFKQSFDSHWGKEGGFKHACWTVNLIAEVNPSASEAPGRHTLFVVPVNPGDPWVAEAQILNRPGETSGKGYVSDWDDGSTIAHEIGHLLGLPDDYTYEDRNGNGKRDANETSVPDPNKAPEYTWNDRDRDGKLDPGEVSLKPGQVPSLMAEHSGQVLPRHIAEIVNKHVSPDQLKCKWAGTIDSGGSHVAEGGTIDFSAIGTLAFEEDDEGALSGSVDVTLTYLNQELPDGPCGGEGRWWQDPLPVTLDIEGQRTGPDAMEIVFKGDAVNEVTWHFVGCGISLSESMPFWQYLTTPGWPRCSVRMTGT